MVLQWIKSTYSNQGNCVEVANTGTGVLVRDSKDEGNGPVLSFTKPEWKAFALGIKDGEFD